MIFRITDYYSYEFIEEGGVYSSNFITKTGTEYRVYFYPVSEYADLIEEGSILYTYGYHFGFTKIGEDEFKKEPFDPRIKNTIIRIIKEFYSIADSKSLLIFQCSDIDGKENKLKRAKRFDMWFDLSDPEHFFAKKNEEVEVNIINENGELTTEKEYLSLIIKSDNHLIEEANNEFKEFKELLSQLKVTANHI